MTRPVDSSVSSAGPPPPTTARWRKTRSAWLIGAAALIAVPAVAVAASVSRSAPPDAHRPAAVQFRTLPPDARLPSGSECARLVQASPSPEDRPGNKAANDTTGVHVGEGFFPAGDSPQAQRLAPLISGGFTGTTEEILRWAACKWGINQNIVFAQAAVESWWRQDNLGGWGTEARFCPPGHGLGADGRNGECPQSYGILQNRYPYEGGAWPSIVTSTAMNADAAYAIWRSCYDGYEVWLNNEPRGQQYHAGDLWGCIGRWYAGSWHTPAANKYISGVKEYLRERVWEQPDFNSRG
jgi:hypothetical protein